MASWNPYHVETLYRWILQSIYSSRPFAYNPFPGTKVPPTSVPAYIQYQSSLSGNYL